MSDHSLSAETRPAADPSSTVPGSTLRWVVAGAAVAFAAWAYRFQIQHLVRGWEDFGPGTPKGKQVLIALGLAPLLPALIGAAVGWWRRWSVRRTVVLAACLLGVTALGMVILHEALYPRLYGR